MDLLSGRLTLARQYHGLTKKMLAEQLGVSTRSISFYENNELFSLSEETEERLVSGLGFPLEFYSGDPLAQPTRETASFRAMARTSARRKDAVLARGAFGYQLDEWLESKFRLPQPDFQTMIGEDPQTAAQSLRGHWQLGDNPLGNLTHLLESKGVRIYSLHDSIQDRGRATFAYSDWYNDRPFIFVNPRMSTERIRFTLAHELGHLILHDNEAVDSKLVEKEADAFASNLLMPADDVLAHAPRAVTITGIIGLKKRWGVAAIALVVRLHQLNLISDWMYRSTCADMSQRGYRTHEPEGMPKETSSLLLKVFQHLRQQGVTKADIAKELYIPVTILDDLIMGITITALGGDSDLPPYGKGRANLKLVKR